MSRCHAYVGEKAPLAAEYHDSDFSFEEHKLQMQPILDNIHRQQEDGSASAIVTGLEWEEFYKAHPRARFFKERRYLLLEFPMLTASEPPQHIVELGCGCGSAIIPVLRANATATATVCDISATSISQLQTAAEGVGVSDRVDSFAADCADPALQQRLQGLDATAAIIVFTLSAVLPDKMLHMLRNAWVSLAPGGLLMIRDHGVYDMVQMRMKPGQRIGPSTYRLADGTISYFFSVEDLAAKCSSVGFEVVECKYVCVKNINKKKGIELRRVFVHGIFKKV